MTRLAATLIAGAAIAYGGAVGYLVYNERALVFIPGAREVPPPAAELGLAHAEVTYPSSDGVRLSAWTVPAGGDEPTDVWLLVCHGNRGNVGAGRRPAFYAAMRHAGFNLLAFDYRGYGASTGTPDERGLYHDAAASYAYLTGTMRVPPERVVIFGHSLGTGVAVELAARVPAAGLILEAPYTSIVEIGQARYPLIPVWLIASQRFPSIDRIAGVTMPVLFLHSPDDDVIPYEHGRRLFDAARAPKRFVDVHGGHDDAYRVDAGVYFGAIRTFVGELPAITRDGDNRP